MPTPHPNSESVSSIIVKAITDYNIASSGGMDDKKNMIARVSEAEKVVKTHVDAQIENALKGKLLSKVTISETVNVPPEVRAEIEREELQRVFSQFLRSDNAGAAHDYVLNRLAQLTAPEQEESKK